MNYYIDGGFSGALPHMLGAGGIPFFSYKFSLICKVAQWMETNRIRGRSRTLLHDKSMQCRSQSIDFGFSETVVQVTDFNSKIQLARTKVHSELAFPRVGGREKKFPCSRP